VVEAALVAEVAVESGVDLVAAAQQLSQVPAASEFVEVAVKTAAVAVVELDHTAADAVAAPAEAAALAAPSVEMAWTPAVSFAAVEVAILAAELFAVVQ
jgi:hypothetical protein